MILLAGCSARLNDDGPVTVKLADLGNSDRGGVTRESLGEPTGR